MSFTVTFSYVCILYVVLICPHYSLIPHLLLLGSFRLCISPPSDFTIHLFCHPLLMPMLLNQKCLIVARIHSLTKQMGLDNST